MTHGRATLGSDAISNASTTFVSIQGVVFTPREMTHKMDKGIIDFLCRNWNVEDLTNSVGTRPRVPPLPRGWPPATQPPDPVPTTL